MSKFSIKTSTLNNSTILSIYNNLITLHPDKNFNFSQLKLILMIALNNRDLFPNISMGSVSFAPTKEEYLVKEYLQKWVDRYYQAILNPPSKRCAKPKSSCSDPAIKLLVQISQQINDETALIEERYHNLFMSAENIQGSLLEEYINSKISLLGWIWCAGNTLRAVDFCYYDGSYLLQIKNKNNTENSSSSNIRVGTEIKKWYRLKTRRENGKNIPDFCWSKLNNIINSCNDSINKSIVSEEDYMKFLKNCAINNHQLITDN